jgi:hypothetical protein
MSTVSVTNLKNAASATNNLVLNPDGSVNISGGTLSPQTGFKNRIINPAMVIDQRNGGASITPTVSTYSVDRWSAYLSTASKFSVQRNAGAVTPPVGFLNYVGATSTSAYSVASGDFFGLSQTIEGFNTSDLGWGTANAQTITLSFWVRSSLTGTFSVSIRNYGSYNRGYPATYTISAANTWEYKTITIAGDTTGTWTGATNDGSFLVSWSLGTGSTYTGTANAWQAGNIIAATGATSVVGTSGATFFLTGVQLEKGSTATPFEFRSIGTELGLCQRYCTVYGGDAAYTMIGQGVGISGTTAYTIGAFPTQMRTQPSFAFSGSWRCEDMVAGSFAVTGMFANTLFTGVKTFCLNVTVASGLTNYRMYATEPNNDLNAKGIFSAEL